MSVTYEKLYKEFADKLNGKLNYTHKELKFKTMMTSQRAIIEFEINGQKIIYKAVSELGPEDYSGFFTPVVCFKEISFKINKKDAMDKLGSLFKSSAVMAGTKFGRSYHIKTEDAHNIIPLLSNPEVQKEIEDCIVPPFFFHLEKNDKGYFPETDENKHLLFIRSNDWFLDIETFAKYLEHFKKLSDLLKESNLIEFTDF